jgi:Domain of unknown function (DU1801)
MPASEDFIYQFEGQQREVLLYFHQLFTSDLNLTDKIRFKIPFYYGRSWICYLNPTKDGKIELAFVRGNELSNEQGILDNKGRKQVYGIVFEKLSDIPKQLIYDVMQEAILLDETMAYASKRKSK